MRIQHNIAAMNSYRNYIGNSNALSKNLEKLSSGYKINRAGDDAAGLAISEKMRAQIAGLDQAQANVKDGISLVKTAEGALQEVQDMMNRMVTLATQSANGTYDNAVDRDNLQKEVDALKSEIDRIADSSNFNGQKLLDGSLEEGGTVGVEVMGLTATPADGTAAKYETANAVGNSAATAVNAGKTLSVTIGTDDGKSYTATVKVDGSSLVDQNGNKYAMTLNTGAAAATAAEIGTALAGAIESATGGVYTYSEADKTFTTKDTTNVAAAQISSVNAATVDGAGAKTDVALGAVTHTAETAAKVTVTSPANALTNTATQAGVDAGTFMINGQKFILASNDAAATHIKDTLDTDATILIGANLGAAASQLAQATGLKVTAKTNDVEIETSSGKALTLQIGDTADSYNQLKVSVEDMHTAALGIAGIDISNIEGAQKAIETIKTAINAVSSTRGNLGAIQNRLEHTQNNLSVMEENIQDAESTIRDTDIADEMTDYTKNNILLQSAQAMLAQANQMPQGVLQLLQ